MEHDNMPKKEQEFFDSNTLEWNPAPGYSSGVFERVLSDEKETGNLTRLLMIEPKTEFPEILIHDYWEEVYILEGETVDTRLKQTFTSGAYACRPPGMKHGPYVYPKGCTMLEIRYNK